MDQRVSLITLGVARPRAVAGLLRGPRLATGAEPGADVVFFQAGGGRRALGPRGWPRTPAWTTTAAGAASRWPTTSRSPAEVDAVIAEAERAGARIAARGAATFWGGYSGVFVDPDGHPWEVAHNPHWTLADDGSVTI